MDERYRSGQGAGGDFGAAIGGAIGAAITRGRFPTYEGPGQSERTPLKFFGITEGQPDVTLPDGTVLGQVLRDHPAAVVTWLAMDRHKRYVEVAIGRTPNEYDPAKGGHILPDRSDGRLSEDELKPGPYLLSWTSVSNSGELHRSWRYLDDVDLVGINVGVGETEQFHTNPLRPNAEGQPRTVVLPGASTTWAAAYNMEAQGA